jgi:DNA-binding NarL/FixJ family response regulator
MPADHAIHQPQTALDRRRSNSSSISSLTAKRPERVALSLLLWEGRSLTYVAEQAGHSVATLARHYTGTMRELEREPRIPAADAIRQAREQISGKH